MKELIYILILLIIFNLLSRSYKEYLVSKPSSIQKKKLADEIMNRSELFTNKYGSLDTARNTFTWLDVVTYEDLRRLHNNGLLNKEEIIRILS